MNVTGILDRLKDDGISITTDGVRLKLVPGSRVPADVAELLRLHKSEVLDYLNAESRATPEPDTDRETGNLLAWACQLAEQGSVLQDPVHFIEQPLRGITTDRVSYYATVYLREISSAHIHRRIGGWGHFTPEWWSEREREALGALEALREAIATGADE